MPVCTRKKFTCKELGSRFAFTCKELGSRFAFTCKELGSQTIMSVSELLEYNPWWRKKDAIKSDPEIQSWNNLELKWNPRLHHTFSAEDYVYSLRGPRQVGKTTLVKLEIERVLKTVPKCNVMYYSFELETGTRRGIMVTKNELRVKNDLLLIPASLFLLLI